METKKWFFLFVWLCFLSIFGCSTNTEQEKSYEILWEFDEALAPFYTDSQAQKINQEFIDKCNFVPTCEEYVICNNDPKDCKNYTDTLVAFKKDYFIFKVNWLQQSLEDRLKKIWQNIEEPKFYEYLLGEREKKIDKEIKRYQNWKCLPYDDIENISEKSE